MSIRAAARGSQARSVEPAEAAAPMVVAVRCRGLNQREYNVAASRWPNRADTIYTSVVQCDPQEGKIGLLDPDSVGTFSCETPHVTARIVEAPSQSIPTGGKCRCDMQFRCDHVFDPTATNEALFEELVVPLIEGVQRGFNAACFAYGQTGSGKTFTMLGSAAEDAALAMPQGLCSLAAQRILCPAISKEDPSRAIKSPRIVIKASYLEIYNEKICDLIAPSRPSLPGSAGMQGMPPFSCSYAATTGNPASSGLEIVEDSHGVNVLGLTFVAVRKVEELEELVKRGGARRTRASTNSNVFSSRSHAILTLLYEETNTEIDELAQAEHSTVTHGKLSMIDLAGSERSHAEVRVESNGAAECDSRVRRREGANINRSLLALGNCITVLARRPAPGTHIPYRDSKLTRLLKESLGGNTMTVMIATISPSCLCFEETVSTLKYAMRAMRITRTVQKNPSTEAEPVAEDPMDAALSRATLRELQDEVAALRTQLLFVEQTNRLLLGRSTSCTSTITVDSQSTRCGRQSSSSSRCELVPDPVPSYTSNGNTQPHKNGPISARGTLRLPEEDVHSLSPGTQLLMALRPGGKKWPQQPQRRPPCGLMSPPPPAAPLSSMDRNIATRQSRVTGLCSPPPPSHENAPSKREALLQLAQQVLRGFPPSIASL